MSVLETRSVLLMPCEVRSAASTACLVQVLDESPDHLGQGKQVKVAYRERHSWSAALSEREISDD